MNSLPLDCEVETPRRTSFSRKIYDSWTFTFSHLLGLVAPAKAGRFARNRKALLSYAAGSRRGPDKKWRPTRKSADETIKRDWQEVTARSRDLVRNSPHISGAIDKIVANVVFNGITPQARLRLSDGTLDKARNDAIEADFKAWAGEVGFYEKQELALRHCWEDGEVLLNWYPDPDLLEKGLVPLGVEGLECDHLDDSIHGVLGNGNIARRGIEFNAKGRPVAYHIFSDHPGDHVRYSGNKSVRVDAENIDHIFLPKRFSQTRGISWLVSIIMAMRNFTEYQNSEQLAARLASAFGIFVHMPHPELMPDAGGRGPIGGEVPGKENAESSIEDLPDYIDPARIQPLPPGWDVTVAENKRPGSNFEMFTKTQLKAGSVGAGMSYGAFSGDFADSSFAAERRSALDERRGYSKQQAFLERRMNNPAWLRFVLFRFLAGKETPPDRVIPVSWQRPGWTWVDPTKDARAAQLDLAMGITTRRQLCAQRGTDFDEVTEELAHENKLRQEKGLENKEAVDAKKTA